MPLMLMPILLGLAILVTSASALYLLINARSVAATFRRSSEIAPGPGKPGVPRSRIVLALVIFNLGWIACIAIWAFAISGEANEEIETETDLVIEAFEAPALSA